MNLWTIISKSGRALPRTLLVSLLSLSMGSALWAQPKSQPAPSRRSTKPAAGRDTKATAPDAVAPEYSSPDTDYAVTGLLSRTTADTNEVDAHLPWGSVLTRRLWQNRMEAPDPNKDAESRAALSSLIRQVRSVRFEDEDTGPAFSVSEDQTSATQVAPPSRMLQPARVQPTLTAPGPARPDVEFTPAKLEKLETVLGDPNQIENPLEMAELLFLSGRQSQATVFYEKALAQTAPNDPSDERDRAWILFQLGNCLRQTDMTRARDMYMKLVSEYPASPWTELAKAHGRLITWYQNAKPQQLMAP